MSLEDMCDPRLRAHLKLLGPERLPTQEHLRIAISDDESQGHKTNKSIGSIENPSSPAQQENKEEEWEEAQVWSEELGGWICGLAPKKPRTESPDRDEAMLSAKPNTSGTQNPSPGGSKGS